MKESIKFKKFQEIAILLNEYLEVIPLLYGSLGLEVLTGECFNSDDVDILVPREYIFAKWCALVNLLESNGYEMVDLHEHTFVKDGYSYSFSYIDNIEEYAQIHVEEINTVTTNECRYKLLTLKQYLAVYERSVCDDYRKTKGKTPKDLSKVIYLREKLKQS